MRERSGLGPPRWRRCSRGRRVGGVGRSIRIPNAIIKRTWFYVFEHAFHPGIRPAPAASPPVQPAAVNRSRRIRRGDMRRRLNDLTDASTNASDPQM